MWTNQEEVNVSDNTSLDTPESMSADDKKISRTQISREDPINSTSNVCLASI